MGTSKPRWIAGGMLCMALGSLVWTLPHFSTDAYMPTLAGEEEDGPVLCGTAGSDGRPAECGAGGEGGEGSSGSLAAYRFVFVFGQLLHGVGAAPLITLGTTFLDESVSKRSSPLYIAVFQTWYKLSLIQTIYAYPLKVCDRSCHWLCDGRFSSISSHRPGEDVNSVNIVFSLFSSIPIFPIAFKGPFTYYVSRRGGGRGGPGTPGFG